MPATKNAIALDVGAVRIGVATNVPGLQIAQAWGTLANDETFEQQLQVIVKEKDSQVLVVGLPRGLDGQETQQTQTIQAFVHKLQASINLPVVWQDESLTSVQAEDTLQQLAAQAQKGDIDALAAQRILQDYLDTPTSNEVASTDQQAEKHEV